MKTETEFISFNRAEFRKTGDLGVKCTCGFAKMTENNTADEVVDIALEHRFKTGHKLSTYPTLVE